MSDSVACIAYCGEKVLLGKRLPGGDMGGKWEFPGGKVERGETIEQAAVREFAEEFSVPVSVSRLIGRSVFRHGGGDVNLHVLEVFILPENPEWKLSEHSQIMWAPVDEIPSLDFVDSDMAVYPVVRAFVLEKCHEK